MTSGVLAPAAITAAGLHFSYGEQRVIIGVDLTVHPGERIALMGASGSGKSTLLHLLAGIIVPERGSVACGGQQLERLDQDARAALRLAGMGFVFQFAELLPELTLRENIELPTRMLRLSARENASRADRLIESLGIAAVADHQPSRVSGGQRQRAAIARALVHRPAVVFADEPTGALDQEAGARALDALLDLSRSEGTTLVVVTHSDSVAERLDRVVRMSDGRVVA